MPEYSLHWFARYGVALLSVVTGTVMRLFLNPILGDSLPYATIFFAILFTAWYGGFGPSLAATIFGAFASLWFLLPPAENPSPQYFVNLSGLILYGVVGLGISLIGGAMRSSLLFAEESAAKAWNQEKQLRVTLSSIGDAVIATDIKGRVTFMNPLAEILTGWSLREANGEFLETVFQILNEKTRQPAENPVIKALREGKVVGMANHTILISRNGTEVPIDDSAAPIQDQAGNIRGVVLVFRDVTERRRAEETQLKLAAIVESADEAIIGKTLEGRITSWNKGAERLYGYSEEEAVGQLISFIIPVEQADELPAIMQKIKRGESTNYYETRRQRKDGTLVHVRMSVSPIRDHEGNILGASAIARDITEKIQAEETLRNREQELRQRLEDLARAEGRIRSVVNNVADGIITIDEHGIVETINPAAERLFDYPANEVVGQNIKMLMPEPYCNEHDGYLANYLQTGIPRIIGTGREVLGRRKDGTTFPMELSVSEFQLSKRLFFTGIVRDITERKRRELALRFLADASTALAGLVDYESTLQKVAGLGVPIFADWCAIDMLDPNGNLRRLAVAHVDPAKVELAHHLQQRYPPDPNASLGVWHILRTGKPELLSEIPESLLLAVARDEEHLRIVRGLGIKSYIGVPLVLRGKTVGAITFVASESGRRYDEQDLALAEDLARRAGIAIENTQLYSELRDADRRKNEFLAMLAHELRNPLAPIRNALQILKRPEADSSTLQKARDMADRQVHHLTRLVDDLLDVSRIMRGKIELRKEMVELSNVIMRAVETAQPLIEAQGHKLTVSLPDEPIWLYVDLVRIAQVIANLLNNAAKYTERAGSIQVKVKREENHLVIRIQDTGIGIAPELLPRVFDIFVQADGSVGRSHGGMGIGLTLVRRLVEMHGGDVKAYSAGPGQGSEFVVRLPILQEQTQKIEPSEGPSEQAPRSFTKQRILVVDDSVDAAESLGMLLRLEGQEVWLSHDGPSALKLAQLKKPTLILLDIGMPGMDGYEVARRIRQTSGLENVLLVALTGWGQEEDRRRTREAGFDLHLVKPVDPEILQKLLTGNPKSII